MQTAIQIRVVIIEDTVTFREEVCEIIRRSDVTRLVGSFESVKGSKRGLAQHIVDVALIDLELADGSGIEVIEWLKKNQPDADCLVLTHFSDEKHLFPALEAGAVGYILKDAVDQTDLVNSIREVVDGGSPMSNSVARGILQHFHEHREPRAIDQTLNTKLTNREIQILEYLSEGFVAKSIAAELDIAYETVRCHIKRIYKKLHAKSAVQAINNWKRGI